MAAPACVRSSWRSAISEGDAEYRGGDLRPPPARALLVPASWPKQLAIASADKREAALYKATGSAAQIVCFPGGIRYAHLAKQSFCDAAISRAGETRGDRAKGCAQSFAPLFGHAMKRRSWRASIHRAPQPRGGMRTRLEIAVKRQLGRIASACGQRLFRPDAMLHRTDLQHGMPAVSGTAHLAICKIQRRLRRRAWTRR
ncbi:hypothetical protein ABIE85_000952 [Bradyrhizobium diazoefficiens]